MTIFIEEPCVSLVELAKRVGRTVDEVRSETAALNMFVGLDWSHQEALATGDAYALVDGSARRDLEHQNAWHAWTVAMQQWQDERETLRRQAFDEAWKANVRAGHNNSPSVDLGHAAAREAVAEYEARNPEPVFAEPESRLQGWLRKVKAGAR
jgi:hypothetical protein